MGTTVTFSNYADASNLVQALGVAKNVGGVCILAGNPVDSTGKRWEGTFVVDAPETGYYEPTFDADGSGNSYVLKSAAIYYVEFET